MNACTPEDLGGRKDKAKKTKNKTILQNMLKYKVYEVHSEVTFTRKSPNTKDACLRCSPGFQQIQILSSDIA